MKENINEKAPIARGLSKPLVYIVYRLLNRSGIARQAQLTSHVNRWSLTFRKPCIVGLPRQHKCMAIRKVRHSHG